MIDGSDSSLPSIFYFQMGFSLETGGGKVNANYLKKVDFLMQIKVTFGVLFLLYPAINLWSAEKTKSNDYQIFVNATNLTLHLCHTQEYNQTKAEQLYIQYKDDETKANLKKNQDALKSCVKASKDGVKILYPDALTYLQSKKKGPKTEQLMKEYLATWLYLMDKIPRLVHTYDELRRDQAEDKKVVDQKRRALEVEVLY